MMGYIAQIGLGYFPLLAILACVSTCEIPFVVYYLTYLGIHDRKMCPVDRVLTWASHEYIDARLSR